MDRRPGRTSINRRFFALVFLLSTLSPLIAITRKTLNDAESNVIHGLRKALPAPVTQSSLAAFAPSVSWPGLETFSDTNGQAELKHLPESLRKVLLEYKHLHDSIVRSDNALKQGEAAQKLPIQKLRFIRFTCPPGWCNSLNANMHGILNVILLAILMDRALLLNVKQSGVLALNTVYSPKLVNWMHVPSDAGRLLTAEAQRLVNCYDRSCECFVRQLQLQGNAAEEIAVVDVLSNLDCTSELLQVPLFKEKVASMQLDSSSDWRRLLIESFLPGSAETTTRFSQYCSIESCRSFIPAVLDVSLRKYGGRAPKSAWMSVADKIVRCTQNVLSRQSINEQRLVVLCSSESMKAYMEAKLSEHVAIVNPSNFSKSAATGVAVSSSLTEVAFQAYLDFEVMRRAKLLLSTRSEDELTAVDMLRPLDSPPPQSPLCEES